MLQCQSKTKSLLKNSSKSLFKNRLKSLLLRLLCLLLLKALWWQNKSDFCRHSNKKVPLRNAKSVSHVGNSWLQLTRHCIRSTQWRELSSKWRQQEKSRYNNCASPKANSERLAATLKFNCSTKVRASKKLQITWKVKKTQSLQRLSLPKPLCKILSHFFSRKLNRLHKSNLKLFKISLVNPY